MARPLPLLPALVACALLLAGCAPQRFSIDPQEFSQERMAHASSMGTMYMNLTASGAAHNCDDTVGGGCCTSGYHLCTVPEFLEGGRQVETTGTNRYTTPYDTFGWADSIGGSLDCSDWTAAAGTSALTCKYNSTAACDTTTNSCLSSLRIWCCSR